MSLLTCGNQCDPYTDDVSLGGIFMPQLLVGTIMTGLFLLRGLSLSFSAKQLDFFMLRSFCDRHFVLQWSSAEYPIKMFMFSGFQYLSWAYRSSSEEFPVYLFLPEMAIELYCFLEAMKLWARAQLFGTIQGLACSLGIMSWESMIFGSLICSISMTSTSWFTLSFFSCLRFLHTWFQLKKSRYVDLNLFSWQLTDVVIQIACLVLFGAALIMSLENAGGPKKSDNLEWSLVNSIYFMVVTVSTVGYGDLNPTTTLGRLATALAVIVTVGSSATVVMKLIRLAMEKRNGLGTYVHRPRYPHVIILGFAEGRTIINCFSELLHTDRSEDSEKLEVVVLCKHGGPGSAFEHVSNFLKKKENLRLQSKVFLFVGDVQVADDRRRVCAQHASCFFILPSANSSNPDSEDRENIVKSLCLRKYHANVRTILLLHRAEYRSLVGRRSEQVVGNSLQEALLRQMSAQEDKTSTVEPASSGSRQRRVSEKFTVLAVDEFKFSLLGKNTEVPLFSTILSNLILTAAVEDSDLANNDLYDWQREYYRSLGLELYEEAISPAYQIQRMSFGQIFLDVLNRSAKPPYGQLSNIIGMGHQTTAQNQNSKLGPNGPVQSQAAQMAQQVGHYVPGLSTAMNHGNPYGDQIGLGGNLDIHGNPIQKKSKRINMKDHTPIRGSTVYLIGLVEITFHTQDDGSGGGNYGPSRFTQSGVEDFSRLVLLNPGPDYQVRQNTKTFQTFGIFIAPDRGSINQLQLGENVMGQTDYFFENGMWANYYKSTKASYKKSADIDIQKGLHHNSLMLEVLQKLDIQKKQGSKIKKPPDDVLAQGGHVLVLITGLKSTKISVGLKFYCENCGFTNFYEEAAAEAARQKAAKKNKDQGGGNQYGKSQAVMNAELVSKTNWKPQSELPIVVLGENVPADWVQVALLPNVYFIQGSPLMLFDLERCNFREASVILVTQAKGGGGQMDFTKLTPGAGGKGADPPSSFSTNPNTSTMVDAESIFVTRFLEVQFRNENENDPLDDEDFDLFGSGTVQGGPILVTDLTLDISHNLLPLMDDEILDQEFMADLQVAESCVMSRAMGSMDLSGGGGGGFGRSSMSMSFGGGFGGGAGASTEIAGGGGGGGGGRRQSLPSYGEMVRRGGSQVLGGGRKSVVDISRTINTGRKKTKHVMKNQMGYGSKYFLKTNSTFLQMLLRDGAQNVADEEEQQGTGVLDNTEMEYMKFPRYASGAMFFTSIFTSLVVGCYFNPSIPFLVKALIDAEQIILLCPERFAYQPVKALFLWLFFKKGLLMLGIYRQSEKREQLLEMSDLDKFLEDHNVILPGSNNDDHGGRSSIYGARSSLSSQSINTSFGNEQSQLSLAAAQVFQDEALAVQYCSKRRLALEMNAEICYFLTCPALEEPQRGRRNLESGPVDHTLPGATGREAVGTMNKSMSQSFSNGFKSVLKRGFSQSISGSRSSSRTSQSLNNRSGSRFSIRGGAEDGDGQAILEPTDRILCMPISEKRGLALRMRQERDQNYDQRDTDVERAVKEARGENVGMEI